MDFSFEFVFVFLSGKEEEDKFLAEFWASMLSAVEGLQATDLELLALRASPSKCYPARPLMPRQKSPPWP